jgi:hypothetical protein
MSAPLTPEREQEFRTLEQAASPAPWFVHPDWPGRVFSDSLYNHHIARVTGTNPEANERFIAAARQAVPELLAEVDRLRAELAARPSRVEVLREAANALVAGPVDTLVSAPAAWVEAIETLRRMADDIEAGTPAP